MDSRRIGRLAAATIIGFLSCASQTHGEQTGWQNIDIGKTGFPGGAQFKKERLILDGSGGGLIGSKDSFHFVFQEVGAEATISARVRDVRKGAAGLMIRGGLAEADPFVAVAKGAGGELQLVVRDKAFRISKTQALESENPWLALRRSDSKVSLLESENSEKWKVLREVKVDLPRFSLAGILCFSSSDRTEGAAEFDKIQISGATGHATELETLPSGHEQELQASGENSGILRLINSLRRKKDSDSADPSGKKFDRGAKKSTQGSSPRKPLLTLTPLE